MMIYETQRGGHVAVARAFARSSVTQCTGTNHPSPSDTAWMKQSLSTPGSEELAP